MPPSRDIVIRLIGDNDSLSRTLKGSVGDLENTKRSMSDVGKTMTRTVTPAAAAVGVAFKAASDDYNEGVRALRAGAGATGQALSDLEASATKLAGQVRGDFGEVSTAMADLATRTGATGQTLEDLTRQTVQMQELGLGGDVETLTRVFGDWGVEIKDSAAAVDGLYRASQTTGPSVDRLGQLMVQFGAPLREFGFNMEESAALLGQFEQQGVNTELVMGALRVALGKFAKAGKDPVEALKEVTGQIENAGSSAEANAIAFEAFGARAGVDMARAIKEGRFSIDELQASLAANTDTVEDAYAETLTLIDRMDMMKDSAMATVGPFADVGFAIAGVTAGIGPALQGIGAMKKNFGSMTTAAKGAATFMVGPWGLAIAAGVTALAAWKKQADRSREATADFYQLLQDNADLSEMEQLDETALTVQFLEQKIAAEGLQLALRETGMTVEDLARQIQAGTLERDAFGFVRVAEESAAGLDPIRDAVGMVSFSVFDARTEAQRFNDVINELTPAMGRAASAAESDARGQALLADSLSGAATGMRTAGELTEWLTGETELLAYSTADATEQIGLATSTHDSWARSATGAMIATSGWREAVAGAGTDTQPFGEGVESYMRNPLVSLGDTLADFTIPDGAPHAQAPPADCWTDYNAEELVTA